MTTSAVDIVVVAFSALEPEAQEEAYARVTHARVTRLANAEGETARMIRSLRRVADVSGGELTPDIYRRARRTLMGGGEEIAEFNAVVRHFGSWRTAKEALGLAKGTTPMKIEARSAASRPLPAARIATPSGAHAERRRRVPSRGPSTRDWRGGAVADGGA